MNRKLISAVGRRTAGIVLLVLGLLVLATIVLLILFGAQSLDLN